MSILSQNYTSFWEQCSYRIKGKIGIAKKIYVQKRQSERKQKFDTPKWDVLNIGGISAKVAKHQGDKWSFQKKKNIVENN